MPSQELLQITLRKGGHRYIFRWPSGRESDLIQAFADLASKGESDFNWFDAAILSYQIGRQIELGERVGPLTQ